MVRSAMAVVAGLLLIAVVALVSPLLLTRFFASGDLTVGHELPRAYLIASLALSTLTAMAAGYLTAFVAKRSALAHALALAALMLFVSLVSMRETYELQPHWYSFSIALVMPVIALWGAILRTRVTGVDPINDGPRHPNGHGGAFHTHRA